MASGSRRPRPVEVGRTGARFGRVTADEPQTPDTSDPAATAESAPPSESVPKFESVLRGYDRDQVDAYWKRRAGADRALREAVSEAQRRLATVAAQARALEEENHRLRSSGPTQLRGDDHPVDSPSGGFGQRAEKLLRLAESEAADLRARAVRDAAEAAAQARSEVETYRHEIERELIARASHVEQHAAQREATLQEREDQLVRQQDLLRAEADRVSAAALRDADRIRREAEARAGQIVQAAEAEAARVRAELAADIDRLHALRDDARATVERIARAVTSGLDEHLDTCRT
jgi:hypothetical protein